MRDFLAEVTKHKREELEQKKAKRPLPSFQNEINPGSGAFLKALADEQLKIIAEVKPRSPSLGNLEGAVDPKDRLSVYEKNADAVLLAASSCWLKSQLISRDRRS